MAIAKMVILERLPREIIYLKGAIILSSKNYIPLLNLLCVVHVSVENVWKTYGTREVLKGVDLSVDKGDIVIIRGPSGIGKTTLLNIITGIDLPDRGEVVIDDENIVEMGENERAKIRLNKIGIIFQTANLIDDLNVVENIALPLKLAGKRWKERVNELIEYLKIEDVKYAFPSSLSGGEMQRVAIARALANEPEILVADEPTSNLDDENTDNIVNLIKKINDDLNVTIIIATHDPRMEALNAKKYTMREGRLYEG